MFEITVHSEEVQAWLSGMPGALQNALAVKSRAIADALKQKVDDKLSGAVLQSKTGLLKNSIASGTEENGDGVRASVFVDGDVPYAAIQEYGGVTKEHIIQAVNSKTLSFAMNGKQSFFAYVNHPGSVIPERSYLRSSLDDMGDEITDGMNDAIESGI